MQKVFVTVTGEEALEFLADRPCDVVLTDYHLPGMNGVTVLQRIREAHPETAVIL